ncbi:hypothetical protein LEP1GSC166_0706 [Leptospira kirschneri]|nr:hypothetical protein LEP1GSC166_0706 [Leptospira kirschneri]
MRVLVWGISRMMGNSIFRIFSKDKKFLIQGTNSSVELRYFSD